MTSVKQSENKILEMKMKKSLLLLISLLVITGLMPAACSGNAATSLAGDWKLISYGASTNPTPAIPDVDTSLIFDSDGTVSGNVGCNGFGGDYEISGETITFGQITSTLMACADPIGRQESSVFTVFTNSATFTIDSDTLIILSADGNSVVVFERK